MNAYFPLSEKEAKEKGIANRFVFNEKAEFPVRLKQLRENKGETLAMASSKIGVTRSTLGLYEKGENVPDVKVLVRIAKHYGATVNYLLGENDRPTFAANYICERTGLSEEAVSILEGNHSQSYEASIYSGALLSSLIESTYFQKLMMNLVQAINYADEEIARETFKQRNPSYEKNGGYFDEKGRYINTDEIKAFLTGDLRDIDSQRKYDLLMTAFRHEAMDLYGDFFTMAIEKKIAFCREGFEKWQV